MPKYHAHLRLAVDPPCFPTFFLSSASLLKIFITRTVKAILIEPFQEHVKWLLSGGPTIYNCLGVLSYKTYSLVVGAGCQGYNLGSSANFFICNPLGWLWNFHDAPHTGQKSVSPHVLRGRRTFKLKLTSSFKLRVILRRKRPDLRWRWCRGR